MNAYMWILAKTKGNQEIRAEKNLINQGFKCLLPFLYNKKFKNSAWVDHKEVMFSGYIFINISNSDSNIHRINNTYGISRLLINKETGIPFIVNHQVIQEMIDKMHDNNNVHNMNKGDNVVITQGKLSKLSGIFLEKCSKYRARLLLKILNKKQEVLVNLENIQKVYT
tara:strand:+ start:1584 stop:2087 length:504 start_codon:yes stop_codon:yes gene_type:complete